MNILPLFENNIITKDTELYSPLFSKVVFQEVRPLLVSDERSPKVIVCEDVLKNPVFFSHEGKAIVWHPSGEMIYSTNMGECMLYLAKDITWEDLLAEAEKNKKSN